jgi:hypothetical protein
MLRYGASNNFLRFKEVASEISNDFSYLGIGIRISEGAVTVSMENWIKEMLVEYGGPEGRASPATVQRFLVLHRGSFHSRAQH